MRKLVVEIISSLLIFLFAYTAFQKFSHHATFLHTLERAGLSGFFAICLSWVVPIIELLVASLLLFPSLRRTGLLVSIILLSGFTIYILYMLLFIPNLPCSCGGVISYLSWKQHLIFNISFLLLSLYGWRALKTGKHIAIRNSRIPVI
ncbi:MauE/DoxX family redox-associated membrane protein [Pinibacter aurantiacus]|uniref:MauE/DoxX family redox-associated membrane protein n=1 Tax=Pinibacter aurantiacus TaxID=2851599 RepID=UPI0037446DD1